MVLYCEGISSITDEQLECFFNIMPHKRQQQALRYVRAEDRALNAAAYALLGYALSLKGIDVRKYTLTDTENGKPYFTDLSVKFNISHTDNVVACIASDSEVGIDVQRKSDKYVSVMNRNYAQREKELIESSIDPTTMFTRIWTLKESYAKCVGAGIFNGALEYDFSPIANGEKGSLYGHNFLTLDCGEFILSSCSREEALAINKITLSELYDFWKCS